MKEYSKETANFFEVELMAIDSDIEAKMICINYNPEAIPEIAQRIEAAYDIKLFFMDEEYIKNDKFRSLDIRNNIRARYCAQIRPVSFDRLPADVEVFDMEKRELITYTQISEPCNAKEREAVIKRIKETQKAAIIHGYRSSGSAEGEVLYYVPYE